jgi:hypothetical protein
MCFVSLDSYVLFTYEISNVSVKKVTMFVSLHTGTESLKSAYEASPESKVTVYCYQKLL